MGRLLDRGPHTVTVTPMLTTTDELGTTTTPGDPVTVTSVMVQPATMGDSDQAASQVGSSAWRVIGPGAWPGGPYSRVRVDVGPPGTEGRVFDQTGEALQRASGRRTAHFAVTMTARGREVS